MGEHYVYALIDATTNEPFYIGCGKGRRMRSHLIASVRAHDGLPMYEKFNALLERGITPTLFKIKGGLSQDLGVQIEATLIQLVGTRKDGTGPLYNIEQIQPVFCWGVWYPSRQALFRDPRCIVTTQTLARRLEHNWEPERAATTPTSHREIICWGESFRSVQALADDPRCVVKFTTLRNRLKRYHWLPEEAATTPPLDPVECGMRGLAESIRRQQAD